MPGTLILSDLNSLHLKERTSAERANKLISYGLYDLNEIDTGMGPKPARRHNQILRANEGLEAFTDDLDFARLDG